MCNKIVCFGSYGFKVEITLQILCKYVTATNHPGAPQLN